MDKPTDPLANLLKKDPVDNLHRFQGDMAQMQRDQLASDLGMESVPMGNFSEPPSTSSSQGIRIFNQRFAFRIKG